MWVSTYKEYDSLISKIMNIPWNLTNQWTNHKIYLKYKWKNKAR